LIFTVLVKYGIEFTLSVAAEIKNCKNCRWVGVEIMAQRREKCNNSIM
jgi:hypothetical protein